MPMLRVFIIGSGRMAWHLGHAIEKSGNIICGIYSRNKVTGLELSHNFQTKFFDKPGTEAENADIVIICVQDDEIVNAALLLENIKGTVVHCSGSVSLDVLNIFENSGVIYPLQTLAGDEPKDLKNVSIVIEAKGLSAHKDIKILASAISENIVFLDSVQRQWLHLAAVFTNNFMNHLWTLAQQMIKEKGIEPQILLPLLKETYEKFSEADPLANQTGPAARGDKGTLEKHLKMLENDPSLWEVYEVMSNSISKNLNGNN
jgi:predicted short-subunit dehydrogenase-like oxidoreductase (DUF2520 family)